MFQVVQLHTIAAPPTSFAPIATTYGSISPLATGLVGLGVGALAGAGYVASRRFSKVADDDSAPGATHPDAGKEVDPKSGPGASA
jgi:hydrogenase small subunit